MTEILGYSCTISGDSFRSDEAERRTGITFWHRHNRGDPHPSPKAPDNWMYENGGGILSFGRSLAFQPLSNDDKLLDMLDRHIDTFRECGATDVDISLTIGYRQQCNLAFTTEELQRVTTLGATLEISCVDLEEE